MINNSIKEEKIAYALPIYNIDFVTNHENDNDILFTIDDNQFLEILVVKITGETIKYSSIKKKNYIKKETELKQEIECIENSPTLELNLNLLITKKRRTDSLERKKIKRTFSKIKGTMARPW